MPKGKNLKNELKLLQDRFNLMNEHNNRLELRNNELETRLQEAKRQKDEANRAEQQKKSFDEKVQLVAKIKIAEKELDKLYSDLKSKISYTRKRNISPIHFGMHPADAYMLEMMMPQQDEDPNKRIMETALAEIAESLAKQVEPKG